MKTKKKPSTPDTSWEDDFPIEQVEASHVSRREFAKLLCLVSGFFAMGTGWIAVRKKIFPTHVFEGEHRVCSTSEVPLGGTYAFNLPGYTHPYILIHLESDEWRAFEQKCTHLSCAVFYKPGTGKIECPCHNGWFDAKTGAVLQGPPPRPLPRLKVSVKENALFVSEFNPKEKANL